jgi:serine palmitoyltransferase
VAAFAKRGDLLIVDEGVNKALLVGVTLSRTNVRYFRHNNMRDLRRVLEKTQLQYEACRRWPANQRRFLVVEGLYCKWGTIAPLDEIVKLKEEFFYRLILDDSHGMTLERFGLQPTVHCEILTFSLEYSLGSVGGVTVGCEEVVDHQRLSGAGYCFSASAPPFLSKVCLESIRRLEGRLEEMMNDIRDDDAYQLVTSTCTQVTQSVGHYLAPPITNTLPAFGRK